MKPNLEAITEDEDETYERWSRKRRMNKELKRKPPWLESYMKGVQPTLDRD